MDKKTAAAGKVEEVFECACELDGGGSEAAIVTVAGDLLSIRRGSDKEILLTARKVSKLETGDSDIKLSTNSAQIRLSKFGRRFDKAAETIGLWYKKGKLSDSVILEKHQESFEEIEYDLARRGRRPGTLRLYATHASITDSRSGKVKRLPYTYVRDILDEGLAVNIRMQKGPDVAISMLGRRKDHLLRRMPELMAQLSKELAEMAGTMLGLESDSDIKQVSAVFRDGRAVVLGQLREKAPTLADAMMRFVNSSKLAPLVRSAEELAFGIKKGLMGELDGDYVWVLAKIGETGVMDAISASEQAARAAYIFKCEGTGFAGFVEDLNWCLTNIGFRREPIYLSEEKLKEPGNESYLQALEDVPELVKVRSMFKGRIAHTEDGKWVDRLLAEAGAAPISGGV